MALGTIPFLAPVDFYKNELRNATLQNLASDPASPVDGIIFYKTATGEEGVRVRIDGAWKTLATTDDVTAGGISSTIVDAKGDLIVGTAADTVARQAVGADGTLLVAASGQSTGVEWRVLADGDIPSGIARDSEVTTAVSNHAGAADPHTGYLLESLYDAKGDLISASAADTPAKLTVGADDTLLVAASGQTTGLQWRVLADGDIPSGIARDAEVTSAISTHAGAADPHAGYVQESLIDAKGDLIVGSAADTVVRQAVGADGTILVAASGQASGVQWRVLAATDIDELIATSDLTDWPRTAALDLNSQQITGLAAGTLATDAVNLGQLTSVASGIDWKESVRVATTAAGTLATDFENGDTVDGVTLATGNRILIKNQATGAENGVYVVAASGAPTRAADANTSAEVTGGFAVWVNEGTANADTGWVLTTNDPITLDTTALTFTQFSGLGQVTAGDGLTKTGNTLNAVGTTNRIDVAADAIDISTSYVGQTSITTLGTITTGTWNGTDIAVADGGTGSGTAAGARTNLGATGKASGNIGDNSSTTIDFTHSLNTTDVTVTVRENTVPGTVVYPVVQIKDVNTVTAIFTTAPTTNEFRVTVVG